MKKVLLRSNLKRVVGVGTKIGDGSVFHVKPGINEVTEDQLKYLKEHPVTKVKFENKFMDIVNERVGREFEVVGKEPATNDSGDSGDSNEGKSIEELGVAEAKKLVSETHDYELLKSWLESETRKTVKSGIEKQIEAIRNDLENSGNNDEE